MNCDDIIRMAREAGFEADEPANDVWITDGYWADTAGMKLYSAPPKREPLTEEEISALNLPPSGTATIRDMVRLIERAHGIGGEK